MKDETLKNAFHTLQTVMKEKRVRYRDLAAALDVSESTIKNIFARQDCRVGRLVDMAEYLGIKTGDLFETSEAKTFYFTDEQERYLVDYPEAFHLFRRCFYLGHSPQQDRKSVV